VLSRPHPVVYASVADKRAVWVQRRRVFGRLAIAMAALAVVLFATHAPRPGALAAMASLLSLGVVFKASRNVGS
jgi:heme A synthase